MTRPVTKCPDCGERIYRKDPIFCPECGLDLRKKPETTSVGSGAFLIPVPAPVVPAPVVPTPVVPTPVVPTPVVPTPVVPAPVVPTPVVPAPVVPTPVPAATPAGYASVTSRKPNQKGGNNMKTLINVLEGIVMTLFGLILLVVLLNLVGCNTTKFATTAAPAATTAAPAATTAAPAATTVPAPAVTTAATDNILPVVAKGLNIGSEQMFLVEPGDVVVGDIAVINNDNTREPLYDNDPATALVTVFQTQTWVWTEWGCFVDKQASQSEIDQLVADKKQDVQNYREVILINWPSN